MKNFVTLSTIAAALLLSGCASEPKPYDAQFCIASNDKHQCMAWEIGKSHTPAWNKKPGAL